MSDDSISRKIVGARARVYTISEGRRRKAATVWGGGWLVDKWVCVWWRWWRWWWWWRGAGCAVAVAVAVAVLAVIAVEVDVEVVGGGDAIRLEGDAGEIRPRASLA